MKYENSFKLNAYKQVIQKLDALLSPEDEFISYLANTAAVLHTEMQFFWTGFYLVHGKALVVGPYQGPVACSRINYGKGVCGKAWKDKKLIRVDDVHNFKGHIACNELTQSEIVIPAFNKKGEVAFVLDVDSEFMHAFDKTDEKYLQEIIRILEKKI